MRVQPVLVLANEDLNRYIEDYKKFTNCPESVDFKIASVIPVSTPGGFEVEIKLEVIDKTKEVKSNVDNDKEGEQG